MKKYAVLCHPQAIKVYKEDAGSIFANELKATVKGLGSDISEASFERIANIGYLVFESCNEPPKTFFSSLARHSAFFALFEANGEMLLPKEADPKYIFSRNMPSMLNYQGKTNELFTRLMINMASSVCKTQGGGKSLLDPVAGKGTTLYDALMLGYDAYGIELYPKYFMESVNFAVKFMQSEKFKHKAKKEKILDEKSRKTADAFSLEFAADKKSFNAGDTGVFKIFAADTRIADRLIKKNSMDMIVGDLPYGIQHAGKKAAGKNEKPGSAESLFAEALPAWLKTLKPGGSAVFSFNLNTTPKEKMALIAQRNGLTILKEDEYGCFHRVDSSIKRDLIAAVKL